MSNTTPTPVGYTTTIECFGDSLTAGTGGTPLATLLRNVMPGRLILGHGIGGQNSAQIAARQGGNPTPVTVSLTGNAFNGVTAVTLTSISNQFLSTQADNTTRYMSGSINGIQCAIARTATGTAPSQVETYTVLPAYSTAVAVAAGSTFIPDDGFNARGNIQVLWMGRNDVPSLTGVAGLVANCVAYLTQPRRYAVIGVLAALGEINGSSNKTAIDAANAQLATAHGAQFIPSTPPTTAEMAAVGYTPTTQDNTDIANGVFPTGMRSDANVHLTTQGYQVFANRLAAVVAANGW